MASGQAPVIARRLKRLLWFVAIWAASVGALALVAGLFRGLMYSIGFRS